MIKVVEVISKKEQKEFVNFPLKLYKDNKYYVPMLYSDEFNIFKPNYPFNKVCDTICFLAYDENEVVGRIQGIIQNEANKKWNRKQVRFTRFDSIDDIEVSNALFSSVEKWAKEKGIDEFVGPLGYSDLEREGLLVEGFDQEQTFEEQYNYEYYQKLIENYGFEKDVDWLEHMLFSNHENGSHVIEASKRMLEKYNLRTYQAKSINELMSKYVDGIFNVLEKTYSKLYGTMPLNKEIVDNYVKAFKMIVRPQDVFMIFDNNDQMVGFALMFPSISNAVRKSNGHITLPFLINFLKTKKNPKVFDLGLMGILPEYESKGVVSIMIGLLMNFLNEGNVDHLETNLILENNYHMLNLLKHFDKHQNKRRRCYKKIIE